MRQRWAGRSQQRESAGAATNLFIRRCECNVVHAAVCGREPAYSSHAGRGAGRGGALPALAGHETPCQQAQRSLAHRHGRPSFLCTLRELLGVDGRDARRTLGRVREPKVGQEVALANVKEKVLAACTSERSRTPGGAGVRQRRRAMACSPLGAAPYRRAARWSSRAAARARRSRTARWRPCLSTRAQCGSRPATCPRRVHGGVSGA